jgi:hypothetical protein
MEAVSMTRLFYCKNREMKLAFLLILAEFGRKNYLKSISTGQWSEPKIWLKIDADCTRSLSFLETIM